MPKLELVVEDIDGARRVALARADSLELCAALDHGGLTPAPDLMRAVCQAVRALPSPIETHILILHEADGFYPDTAGLAQLEDGIDHAKQSGATGVVFGALTTDNTVNAQAIERLVRRAYPLQTTFHRAFDRIADQRAAIDLLVDLGVTRILTSGRPGKAPDHIDHLRSLVAHANNRIILVVGSGIRADTLQTVARGSTAPFVHMSCRMQTTDSQSPSRTDAALAASLVALCRDV